MQRLAADSGPGHAWLAEKGIELPILSQNGGHSAARTHRPTKGGAGSFITNSLLRKLKKKKDLCEIRNQSCVTELLQDAKGTVNGVVYKTKAGETVTVNAKAVILASGGFGGSVARGGEDSLL